MPKTHKISEMIAKMRPVWEAFITKLGYTEEQAKAFADGYANQLGKFGIVRKLRALQEQDPQCMTSGLKHAGIDQDEAVERFTKYKKNKLAKRRRKD